MSTEPLCLIFFKSVEELNYHNAFIYIKVKKSIILPFQSKNNHIPTSFNLNNAIIKLFLETNVNTPIHNIIESFSVVYPRKDWFINSKNEKYSDQSLYKILHSLLDYWS